MVCSLVTESCGLRIRVDADDPDLLTSAVPWLPEGWQEASDAVSADRVYRLQTEEPADVPDLIHYTFEVDGSVVRRSAEFTIFCDLLENSLHHYIATYTRGPIFVHAGVAVWRGRAIVIPGRSYAGKSTLTEALLQAGAIYYSDDYAPIDAEGRVHPFPRHLRLRNYEEHVTQLRVDPVEAGWPVGDVAVPVGIVAALRFDREAGWSAAETSRGAGVLALLNNTVAARERPVDAMGVMARAVESAVVVEGTRGEASDAAERLMSMLAGA